MKIHRKVWAMLLIVSLLAGTLVVTVVALKPKLSAAYKRIGDRAIMAETNILPSRPYVLESGSEPEDLTLQEFLAVEDLSVEQFFSVPQYEQEILRANSLSDLAGSRAEIEGLKAIQRGIRGLGEAAGNWPEDRLKLMDQKIDMLLRDKSGAFSAYSGPLKGTWTTPDQVLLRWAPEAGWIPEKGYDLYRTAEGKTEKIASGLGSQLRIEEMAQIDPAFAEISLPVFQAARLDAAELKLLGFASQAAADRALYESAIPNAQRVRIPGAIDFALELNRKISIPADISGRIPGADRFGNTALHFAKDILIRPSVLGSELPFANQVAPAPQLPLNETRLKLAELADARNSILTRAFTDDEFALQSGFGFQDNLEAAPGIPTKAVITYLLVPVEGENENLSAADISAGKKPQGAFSLTLERGAETAVEKPAGLAGYGIDDEVSLRWDSPKTPYAKSIIVGYYIERQKKGEKEFTLITDTPVAISYSEDELGILYETPSYYMDLELKNGEEAAYRIQALDVFGRVSDYSETVDIKVFKVAPPQTPHVGLPELSSQVNAEKSEAPYQDIAKSNKAEGVILPITSLSADTNHFVIYRSKAEGTGFFDTPQELVRIKFEPYAETQTPMIANNRIGGKFLLKPRTEAKTDVLYYDNSAEKGCYYRYWVAAVDSWGNESPWSESKTIGFPLENAPAPPAEVSAALEPYKLETDKLLAPGFYRRFNKLGAGDALTAKSNYLGFSFSQAVREGLAVPKSLSLIMNNLPKSKDIHDLIALEHSDILPDGSAWVPWYHYGGEGVSGYSVYRAYADNVTADALVQMSAEELVQGFEWKLVAENIKVNQITDKVEIKEGRLYLFMICLVPKEVGESVLESFETYVPGGWLRVDWKASEDSQVKYYRVYRAEVDYFTDNQDTDTLDWQMVGDNLKYPCYSEKVDQTYAHYYYFKVTAVSTWGVESVSGTATRFRLPATSPPQAPAMLVPFSKKEVNQVNWVGVPHASKYVIYRHTVPRVTQADLISVQSVAPSLFNNLFSPKVVRNIFFSEPSKLKLLPGLKLPGQDTNPPATPKQMYALTGKLNTLKLKTPTMIRQSIEKADMNEKLDMYSAIVEKHGVLAVAPYGSLDLSAALSLLWTPIGEINIAQGQDSTGEKSFFDETAVFGETYLYTVQAYNDDNLGSDRPDPVSVFTRKGQPFPAVTGLKFKAVDGKAVISWDAAKDPNLGILESQEYVAGYILYRSNEETGTYYQASAMLPCDQLSYTDPNINLTSENWYVIRVVDTAGFMSDFSQPLHVTVADTRILPKSNFKIITPGMPIGGLTPQNPATCAQLPADDNEIVLAASEDSISRGSSTAQFVPITPPIIKPPDLIWETMLLNGFTISQIKITNLRESKGEGVLNLEGGYEIPVTLHVKKYGNGVITEGTAESTGPVALGNTGVYLKSVSLNAAAGKSLTTGYVMRDAGNIMGDMRILAFADSQINPGGIIHILDIPVFHYENLTFTGVSKITINLNQVNYTGVPVLNKPGGNIAVPTLVGNCFINLHEGTAETNMGLETMDNKGLEFKFTLLGFDAQGRLSGDLALNGEQYMRTVIPAGLGIKATSGALAYRGGGVDAGKSSLAGKVLTPFLTFKDELPKDPKHSLIKINAAQINTLARPAAKPSSLSAADISVLNNGLNYYAGLAQNNSLLVAPEKPAALTTVSSLPFSVNNWDGNGFLLQDTSMTPVCIGEKPYSFGFLGDEHVDAIGATPDKVALDLSKTAAYSGEGAEDIKTPSWMGIVVKKGNVSLPPDYIKSKQGQRIRFNLTAGELLYDRNGFFYQNQAYTPEGVPASFGDALGGFEDVIVKNVAIDLYNNKTNLQVTGELAVPLFNSRLQVKLYTDEKVQKLVCSVAETEKMDPAGKGTVKIKILNGYLDPLGLHVDGTLDFAIADSIAFEDIQFNDLLLPADWSKLEQEDPQNQYGRALFDKPYQVDFHKFPMEVRALSVITRKTNTQITNGDYSGPAYDTTMTLWGGMQLSDNLPLDTNQDADRIVIGNVFADPAVEYSESKSKINMDFEDFAQFEGVGTPKLADSGDGIVEYETEGLEMVFNGGLDAFAGMPLQVNTRIGYDRQKERSFFAIAIFYGRENSSLPRPPGIPLVFGELNDITGVIGYNLDMPKNPDGTYDFPKEKTALFQAIDTMAVSKSAESNYFMAMSACLYMGYGGINLGEVRNLYLVVETGPSVEIGGYFYGPDSLDDFVSTDGAGLKLMGEAHLGYYHPQRLYKFSLSLYDAGMYGFTVSGDVGFDMCPSYWELRLGYPEALSTNVFGSVAWFGIGIRSSDIDQSFIKAQAGFGYDTGDVTIGIVYVRGYLYAGGDGEYVFDDGSICLHVFVEGGIEGGVKVSGKRFRVIQLMLRADGTLVRSDSWSLSAQARIHYCVDLWLTDISGSVSWHVNTSF